MVDKKPIGGLHRSKNGDRLMATLSELAAVIAEVEGVDHATVTWIGRSLREAKLVAKRGRGPSAAQMGWSDASNMLIAVNATRNTAEAVRAASAYRRFRPDEHQFQNPEMNRDFTLGEAIEQLLLAAGTSKPPTPFLGTTDYYDLLEAFETGEAHVELRFRTSTPSALLRIAEPLDEARPEVRAPSLLVVHFSPRKVRDPPEARQDRSGDRLEETTIGFRTLREVGRLIRSHS
jgi:hypothetical protein